MAVLIVLRIGPITLRRALLIELITLLSVFIPLVMMPSKDNKPKLGFGRMWRKHRKYDQQRHDLHPVRCKQSPGIGNEFHLLLLMVQLRHRVTGVSRERCAPL